MHTLRFPFRLIMSALCLLSVLSSRGFSQASQNTIFGGATISYQGMLTQNDMPASGEHRISVSLWNAASGGEPIWSDDFTTQVTRGVFNLALGSDKALPQSLGDATWISVSIDGGPPNSRSRLTAVPYALSSSTLSTDYVSSISVNGERIAGRASDVNIVTGDGIGATVDPATSSILLSLQNVTGGKGAKSQSLTDGDWSVTHSHHNHRCWERPQVRQRKIGALSPEDTQYSK